jgi:transcriptional regulator with XRE-family HTH domain
MTFGETLSRLMDKAGVKRVQLAEHLGYDVSYISRWAGGQKLPSVKNNGDLIKQIAAYISKSAGEDEKSAVCAAFGLESRLSGAEFEKWVASVLTAAYGEQLAKSSSGPSRQSPAATRCSRRKPIPTRRTTE